MWRLDVPINDKFGAGIVCYGVGNRRDVAQWAGALARECKSNNEYLIKTRTMVCIEVDDGSKVTENTGIKLACKYRSWQWCHIALNLVSRGGFFDRVINSNRIGHRSLIEKNLGGEGEITIPYTQRWRLDLRANYMMNKNQKSSTVYGKVSPKFSAYEKLCPSDEVEATYNRNVNHYKENGNKSERNMKDYGNPGLWTKNGPIEISDKLDSPGEVLLEDIVSLRRMVNSSANYKKKPFVVDLSQLEQNHSEKPDVGFFDMWLLHWPCLASVDCDAYLLLNQFFYDDFPNFLNFCAFGCFSRGFRVIFTG